MQIVVIGAGMVGSNVTYRLAEAGAQVTVLDAGRPGGGTSRASFAWLNAHNKTPREYFELNLASMREHARLGDELGGAPWLSFTGGLAWAGDEAGRAALRANADRLNSWDYPVELLTAAQARGLEPDLDLGPDDEVIFAPGEGWVANLPLIHTLLERAGALGASVRPYTRVVEIVRSGARAEGVVLESGERLTADVVVDCAGPWSDEVAAAAGMELPLNRQPGLLAYSPPVATCLTRVCHAPGVHFRPDGGGRIVMGQDWHEDNLTPDSPNALPPRAILDRAARWLPALAGVDVEASRIGVRPMPKDGLPMLGFLPGLDGFYTVVSHSGVTLGPLWGRLVAAEVYLGKPDPRLEPFRPTRFLRP
jgi:glycine/D-amino acid oxidase-like deaminating enzyme